MSKSDDEHLIKQKKKEKGKISNKFAFCIVQQVKKLEGIIKMSLAFHMKKTLEEEVKQNSTHHYLFTQIELADLSLFLCNISVSIDGNALFRKHLLLFLRFEE